MKIKFAFALAFSAVAWAVPITVLNPSFESAILPINGGNGPFSQLIASPAFGTVGGTLTSWIASSTDNNANAGGFDPSPGGSNWTTKWWDGNNIGYVQGFFAGTGTQVVSLSQTLSATLLAGTVYTLTVDVGRRSAAPASNYSIQLFAGANLLATANNLFALPPNSFGTDSATYSSPAGDPLAGQALRIVLSTNNVLGGFHESFFDNVRLDAVPPAGTAPEPGTAILLPAGFLAYLWRRSKRF